MNANILLVIVLLILVFCTINGYRKGLLGIVYGFISWIFIFIFIIWSNPYIEDYLRTKTNLYDRAVEYTENYLLEKADSIAEDVNGTTGTGDGGSDAAGANTDADIDSGNKSGENIFGSLGIQVPQAVEKAYATTINNAEDKIVGSAAAKFGDFIIKGIAVLIALVIAWIITGIVGYMVRLVGELPVVHGINGFFGVIAGAFQGLLYVWIMMYIIAWIATSEWGRIMLTYINQNAFLTYLYQHNLVITILENF